MLGFYYCARYFFSFGLPMSVLSLNLCLLLVFSDLVRNGMTNPLSEYAFTFVRTNGRWYDWSVAGMNNIAVRVFLGDSLLCGDLG